MASPIRAILFDKDGTLLDFEATWGGVAEATIRHLAPDADSAAAMAEAAGYDPVTKRFRAGSAIVAGASHEVARLWARWRPDLGTEAIEAYLNTLSIETSGPATLVPAVPEMAGLLGRLKASGLALGVATHDSEQAARAQLRELGVLSMFAFIAGYDSGHGLKPGPGMLQAFATATGVPAAQIAMVGDSIHDLAMVANAGGGLAVGVLSGPAGADDLSEHADHILPSIAGLPALLGLD